jgi:hypothetical protein
MGIKKARKCLDFGFPTLFMDVDEKITETTLTQNSWVQIASFILLGFDLSCSSFFFVSIGETGSSNGMHLARGFSDARHLGLPKNWEFTAKTAIFTR